MALHSVAGLATKIELPLAMGSSPLPLIAARASSVADVAAGGRSADNAPIMGERPRLGTVVQSRVLAFSEQHEVLRPIVCSVAIDVMNVLGGSEFTADQPAHDRPVFVDPSVAVSDQNVAAMDLPFGAAVIRRAGRRAKQALAITGKPLEWLAAVGADSRNPSYAVLARCGFAGAGTVDLPRIRRERAAAVRAQAGATLGRHCELQSRGAVPGTMPVVARLFVA